MTSIHLQRALAIATIALCVVTSETARAGGNCAYAPAWLGVGAERSITHSATRNSPGSRMGAIPRDDSAGPERG